MRLTPFAPLLLAATAAHADVPQVVADIAPIQSLVAQVMGDLGPSTLLVTQGSDPHSMQLRPSQARSLSEADLLVWVGPPLEPWLADAAESLAPGRQLVLLETEGTHIRTFAEGEADEHDHGEEAGHDDEHGDEDHAGDEPDHEHLAGDIDPHAWLDPDNARTWLGAIAEDLATLDPDNAATYRANAAAAQAQIAALDTTLSARLAPFAGDEIVTFHAAFGYFTDHYPIEIAGSVRAGDASSPSAAALGELRGLVAEHHVACAFSEPAYNPALLEAIAAETGLRIGSLDPAGALQEPGPGNYAATLTAIADGIASCLEQG